MSRILVASVAAATLAVGGSLLAQSAVTELNYSAVDLLKTPKDVYVGEVGGVGSDSKGQIFVYTRTGHPYATLADNRTFSHGGSRLFVFDKNGQTATPEIGDGNTTYFLVRTNEPRVIGITGTYNFGKS